MKNQIQKQLEVMDSIGISNILLIGGPKEIIYGVTGFTKWKMKVKN
tara:strand:- start:264 stop:401 length:138 start_codon:yes stop_codon:yes gene_type:complete